MFEEIISKCKLQVRKECQFFGALMLFASIKETKKYDTACTDGKDIYFNMNFLKSLNSSEQNALMLHEVLHMALLHVTRRQNRDPKIWNIAADIVVNDLILRNTPFRLPKGAIIDKTYSDKSVEFVYESLLKNNKYKKHKSYIQDLKDGVLKDGKINDNSSQADGLEIESYWKDKIQVLKNSDMVNNSDKFGSNTTGGLPDGMDREVENILEPEVNWRHALWKYVGRTPADFDDLDRRFLYRGLYLEGLMTEALEVSVCVDTSGSVSRDLIDQFVAEINGILKSYPHVKCDFFFCDCELSGPFKISSPEEIPVLKGGGGTSFVPFFKYLEKNNENHMGSHKVSIYLTDGYEEFPKFVPKDPVMWLVSADGEETSEFPFGEVIRISTESWH